MPRGNYSKITIGTINEKIVVRMQVDRNITASITELILTAKIPLVGSVFLDRPSVNVT